MAGSIWVAAIVSKHYESDNSNHMGSSADCTSASAGYLQRVVVSRKLLAVALSGWDPKTAATLDIQQNS